MVGPWSRRSLVRAGVTGIAGLSLADMSRAAGDPCGRVLGTSRRRAGEVTGGAVSFQDMCGAIHHVLGLDPSAAPLADSSGRPHPLVETGRVIRAVV